MLPPTIVQEMFFDCVESMVKEQKRKKNKVHEELLRVKSASTSRTVNSAIQDAVSRNSIDEVIKIKKAFATLLDSQKAEILTRFVDNKVLLKNLYDFMFEKQQALPPKASARMRKHSRF